MPNVANEFALKRRCGSRSVPFIAPVQLFFTFFIILCHEQCRCAALGRTPAIALVMAESASVIIICGREARRRDGNCWSTRISIHHSLVWQLRNHRARTKLSPWCLGFGQQRRTDFRATSTNLDEKLMANLKEVVYLFERNLARRKPFCARNQHLPTHKHSFMSYLRHGRQ